MEHNLKIKFKYRGLEFELEGREETVKEQFKTLKTEGLDKITSSVDNAEAYFRMADNHRAAIKDGKDLITDGTPTHFPSIRSLVLKGLPKSETEWILIYGFYASNYGSDSFTRQDILDSYTNSGRSNKSRVANISKNIVSLTRSDLLNAINDQEFSITQEGSKKVNDILNSEPAKSSSTKSKTKVSKSSKKPKSKSKSSYYPKLLKDLNLKPQDKVHFRDYFNSYELSSTMEKILVIVNYLSKVLEEDNISLDHIFTALKDVGERIPTAFKQSITDIQTKKGWIEHDSYENIRLTIVGDNYFNHDLKKKQDKGEAK